MLIKRTFGEVSRAEGERGPQGAPGMLGDSEFFDTDTHFVKVLRLLCPGISDVDLFRYREGTIHLNAKVSDGAFDLGVAGKSCTARKLPVRR
jgi:hypothetical protein